MIVYRLEIFSDKRQEFVGPYKADSGFHIYELGMRNVLTKHPHPNREGIDFTENHYFGFQDLNLMYRWFTNGLHEKETKFRDNLRTYHFISLYDDIGNSDTLIGKKQIAFVKHKARFIGRFPFMKTKDAAIRNSQKMLVDYLSEG